MRQYQNDKLEKVICNKCGKELQFESNILKEGCFQANITFDYFSNKDGETHRWDLCESCYDALTSTFLIPLTRQEETELL